MRLIRLKCRLGASHPKIAENNVALTTIAIDVPQWSARVPQYEALMFYLRRRKQNMRSRNISIKQKQQAVHVQACGFICNGVLRIKIASTQGAHML